MHERAHACISMDAATDQQALPNPPLVLHAPLISTRRSSASLCHNPLAHSTSTLQLRVPFSWETSPGVPRSRLNDSDSDDPPPPKLPPGRRWANEDDEEETNGKLVRVLGYDPYASGSSEEGEEDLFSDALEKISASDRFDVACRLSSFGAYKSPGFIMDRFLPAANALAKSSVRRRDGRRRGRDSSPSHQMQREAIYRERLKQRVSMLADDPRRDTLPPLDPYAEVRAESPSMACGLMLFFPWSFKPTVCGFKTPARTAGTPRSADLCSTPNKLYTSKYIDQGTNSITLKSPLRARNLSNRWSSDEEDNGSGGGGGHYVEKLSVKVRHSHGWRMPFLDTTRLSSTASQVEKWKGKARRTSVRGHDADRKEMRSNELDVPAPESRRGHRSTRLPQFASPSQSWLSQALASINKKT